MWRIKKSQALLCIEWEWQHCIVLVVLYPVCQCFLLFSSFKCNHMCCVLRPVGHLWDTWAAPMRQTLPGKWGALTGMSLSFCIPVQYVHWTRMQHTVVALHWTHRCALQSVRQLSNIVIDCCQAQHLVSNKSSCQKTEWNNLLFLFYLDFKICHSWSIIWFGEWIRISGHRLLILSRNSSLASISSTLVERQPAQLNWNHIFLLRTHFLL